MSGSLGVRGNVRPTAGRPLPGRSEVRTGPLVAVGVFLGAVLLLGLVEFVRGF